MTVRFYCRVLSKTKETERIIIIWSFTAPENSSLASSKRIPHSNLFCENHFSTKQGSINNVQFTLEDNPLNTIQWPEINDVSGDSGEKFVVHSISLPDLEEKVRFGGPRSGMMSAFVGAASETMFTSESEDTVGSKIIGTAGTLIERQMMDIIEEHHFSRESSSTSFVDTKLENSPMSPWEQSRPMHVPMNNYGRPKTEFLPTSRNDNHGSATINRSIPTYLTNFAANNPDFQTQQSVNLGHQQVYRLPDDIQTRR